MGENRNGGEKLILKAKIHKTVSKSRRILIKRNFTHTRNLEFVKLIDEVDQYVGGRLATCCSLLFVRPSVQQVGSHPLIKIQDRISLLSKLEASWIPGDLMASRSPALPRPPNQTVTFQVLALFHYQTYPSQVTHLLRGGRQLPVQTG